MLDGLMARLHAPVYASRLAGLVGAIGPHLEPGDAVLDVGAGTGALGRALRDSEHTPADLAVRGVENHPRPDPAIPIDAYPGGRLPYDDDAFDVVVVADVLHHEPEPEALLAEAARVARRRLVVKDHQVAGPLAQSRVNLMDWAANSPYGVACLYRYPTPQGWAALYEKLGLPTVEVRDGMTLYPPPYRWVFTARLQHFAVLDAGGG